MAPRKRARTSSSSGSSSSSSAAPTITLSGGEACPSGQVLLWRAGQLTDTVVTVEGCGFAANKNVLAGGSDYFRSHFLNEQMARGAVNPTLQEHVSADAFEPLLDFLYQGECTFDETKLTEVLQAASFLTVKPLEQAAVVALTERLSPSNAFAAWSLADQLSLSELAEAAKVTALKDFEEVEGIEEATLAQVQSLVADDRLTAKSEESVFSAVARFAVAKQPAEADLFGLLRSVRIAQMSKDFLLGTVVTWRMLDTKAGKDMIIEMLASAQQSRGGFGGRFLYVLGGTTGDAIDENYALSTVEVYDTTANRWYPGLPMPRACALAAAAVLDGDLYLVGGLFDSTERVDRFNARTGMWAAAPSMRTKRRAHATAVAGGKLYAIGGGSDDLTGETLCSVEAFDPQTATWTVVAAMSEVRYAPAAAELDGKIYVTGGQDDDDNLDTVEVYDPQTNTWATVPPMGTARSCHGVAELGGKIYAVGGHDTHSGEHFNSVEAFDPHTSTWSNVAPMKTTRSFVSLIAARGKIYAVGGSSDGSSSVHATAEAYDPQQDRWETVAPMAQARRFAAAACMLHHARPVAQ